MSETGTSGSPRQSIAEAIHDLDDLDGDGAPVGAVIEAALDDYPLGTILPEFDDMKVTGEVYAPARKTVRLIDDDLRMGREANDVQTGERIMQSPLTETWYLVTKWRDKGEGKAQAIEKEEIPDDEVEDAIKEVEGRA